jgi:hypothetical protein
MRLGSASRLANDGWAGAPVLIPIAVAVTLALSACKKSENPAAVACVLSAHAAVEDERLTLTHLRRTGTEHERMWSQHQLGLALSRIDQSDWDCRQEHGEFNSEEQYFLGNARRRLISGWESPGRRPDCCRL